MTNKDKKFLEAINKLYYDLNTQPVGCSCCYFTDAGIKVAYKLHQEGFSKFKKFIIKLFKL